MTEDEMIFRVGDLVTRDGTDVHRVISSNDDGFLNITVVCITAPASGWCKIGDEEANLARRYDLVARAEDAPSTETT
jgi:hypothetical protein